MLLWTLLLAAPAPSVVPDATMDARLRVLAERGSLIASRMSDAILQDPAMRAEWRRVGFEPGCAAFASAETEARQLHVPALVDPTVAAIRKVVPEERLAQLRVLSFSFGGLQVYRRRIEDELNRTSGDHIANAIADVRQAFQLKVQALQANVDPGANLVTPKSDIAAALGVKGSWDLDNPSQLGMACAEARIPPSARPQINVGVKN